MSRQGWTVMWIIGALTVVAQLVQPIFFGGHGAGGGEAHGEAAASHATEAAHGLLISLTHVPGFYAAFGLLGCLGIILASKWIGHAWLMKPEGYWASKRYEPDMRGGDGH